MATSHSRMGTRTLCFLTVLVFLGSYVFAEMSVA
ncbi:hypothetical protein ACP70R_000049 [Stipagrostis hirtigluma subsp. patula]